MKFADSVLYEDNHLLVVNKPGGIPTQPSGTDQINLESMAKEWIKHTYQKPGNVFLEALHRLDKPVSGVVAFAKTSKALSRLNASMRNKDTQKMYWALVEVPNQAAVKQLTQNPQKLLENYLLHDDFKASVASVGTQAAKLAQLHYSLIHFHLHETQALLQISLLTGRYHQIRAQLSHIHLPIIGDAKYGSKTPFHSGAIALHHRQLQFPHPTTQKLLTIEAPLPQYWPALS